MNSPSKQQVIIIHGGDTFDTYEEYLVSLKNWDIDFEKYKAATVNWKEALAGNLGEGYEVILPSMPNKMNAKYAEWKIWFEKLIPYFSKNIILVGHSLGGTFIVKYLSENKLALPIFGVFLVAPVYNSDGAEFTMADFIMPQSLELLENQTSAIFLYHSQDDQVVPFGNVRQFQQRLKNAIVRIFENKGHFNQSAFPELVGDIKNLDRQ
jgi:predicted alpha/beta hydrolase family esterase